MRSNQKALNVSTQSSHLLFEALGGCPPLILWLCCENASQADAFTALQSFYVDLRQSLNCYANGMPLPVYESKSYQSLVRLRLSNYSRLYEAIALGWEFLLDIGFQSPGLLLRELIAKESEFMFRQSQARWKDFTPRGAIQYSQFLRKLEAKACRGEKIPDSEKNRFKAKLAESQSQRVRPDLMSLHLYCIETLESVKRPPRELKSALSAYRQSEAEIIAFSDAYYHPRHKRRGIRVVKGIASSP